MFDFLGHKWGEPTLGTESGPIEWSADLSALTPAVGSSVDDLEIALQSAFDTWESVAALEFVEGTGNVDLTIGDDFFGANSLTLAVATISDLSNFAEPTFAQVEFNNETPWSPFADSDPDTTNFFAVALHEIGHIIGLEHVDDPTQIMNPFLIADNLGNGDIQGIQALYGTDGSDVPVVIDQDELDDAIANATDSVAFDGGDGGGDDGGGGGGGAIIAILLGIVALAMSVFTGGAGAVAVLAAGRAMDDDGDEPAPETANLEEHPFYATQAAFEEDFLPGIAVDEFGHGNGRDDLDDDDELFLF